MKKLTCHCGGVEIEVKISEKGFENLKLWTRGIDRNIFKPRPI